MPRSTVHALVAIALCTLAAAQPADASAVARGSQTMIERQVNKLRKQVKRLKREVAGLAAATGATGAAGPTRPG